MQFSQVGSLWNVRGPVLPVGSLWNVRAVVFPVGSLWGVRDACFPVGSLWNVRDAVFPVGSLWNVRGAVFQVGSLRNVLLESGTRPLFAAMNDHLFYSGSILCFTVVWAQWLQCLLFSCTYRFFSATQWLSFLAEQAVQRAKEDSKSRRKFLQISRRKIQRASMLQELDTKRVKSSG